MPKLLVDTSALLALALDDDQHHPAAVQFAREHQSSRLVVTELIVAEFATRVRSRLGAERTATLARSFLDSRRYDVVFVDEDMLRAALALLERFSDKRLSLTDCASFALMDRLRLQAAFSFDRDFGNCGYAMVP